MGTSIVPYVMPECSTCHNGCAVGTFRVGKNPEVFCSLICCKIFYCYPVPVISQLRKEGA